MQEIQAVGCVPSVGRFHVFDGAGDVSSGGAPVVNQNRPRTRKERKKVKSKTIDHLALARRIRAAGCPIHIEEDDTESACIPSDGLTIRQFGGVPESTAIDCSGGTAFIIYVTISINVPHFAISAFGLEVPWINDSLRWLEDPREIGGSSDYYSFGIKDLPDFERGRVLNHRAHEHRPYSSGTSLKGCLLGISFDPIPVQFSHGDMIPGLLVVFDQFLRKYRSPVELWADRLWARPRAPRKGRLFERRDPVVRS